MKKGLSLVLVFVFAFAMLTIPALAVSTRWANILTITPHISQSDGEYSCTVTGVPGTTKIECTMVLHEKGFFGYHEVARTSDVGYSISERFEGTYNIKAGKTYKLVITVTVTSNGTSETAEYAFEKDC